MNRTESCRRIEQEIRQAKAEALGRVGERLASALAELSELDRRLDRLVTNAPADGSRQQHLARELALRNRVRDEALRLRLALQIQREAIGLARHGTVEERYPVPPKRTICS